MILSSQKNHREKAKGGRNCHDDASTSSPSAFNCLFVAAIGLLSMSLLALSPATQVRPNLLSNLLHGFNGSYGSSPQGGCLSVFFKGGDVMDKDFGQGALSSKLFNEYSKRDGRKERHTYLDYSACTGGAGSAELQAAIANAHLDGVNIDADAADADTTRSFGLNFKEPSSSSLSSSAFRFLVKSFNDYDSEIEYKATLANQKSNNYDAASSSPVLPIFEETPTDLAKDHLLNGVSANASILKFAESPSSLAAAVFDKNSKRSAIFTCFATMAALVVGLILTHLTSPPKRGRCTVMHTGKAFRKVDIAGRLMKFPVFACIVLLTVVGNMPTALAGTITNERITQKTTNRKNDDGAKVDFVVLTPEQSTVLYADDVRKDTTYKIDAVTTRTSSLNLSSNQSKEKELLPKVRYVELTQYYATICVSMSHGISHTTSPSELS